MNCYKTAAKWNAFFEFIKQNFDANTQGRIGFMYRPTDDLQDIFIKSADKNMLATISKKYGLTPCEQPGNFIDSDWRYTGNHSLFEDKL
ncbi:hypothetical protein [Cesiribacter sp. SM1]|uniref:hypothetical protein n=1 Tax=Cesiribacter sp. SM1 TaxID=2861196 RepID=UPI001CD33634|nr:hypothetical protein [Cesiribacter sp. SM1]